MKTVALAACLVAVAGAARAEPPPTPTHSSVPGQCKWEWLAGGGVGIWAERCDLETGVWVPRFDAGLPGFVLTVNGNPEATILQVFDKPADAEVSAILPALRARGYIPDDDDCVFEPAAIRPAPRTIAFYTIMPTGARKEAFEATPDDDQCVFEPAAIRPAPRTVAFYTIMPTGARKEAFEATPDDEVPEPPCGEYGWSTHGVRYFLTDTRFPGRVVYVNTGQDGTMFDDTTITLE